MPSFDVLRAWWVECRTKVASALLERGSRPPSSPKQCDVDPKTVERWIVGGRVPYRRHRFDVAAFLGVDEAYLWPDALIRDEVVAASESEIIAVYPHRSDDAPGHLGTSLRASRARDRRPRVRGHLPGRGRRPQADSRRQGRRQASACGSCSEIPRARRSPSAGRTRASMMRSRRRSATRIALYRAAASDRGRRVPASQHGPVQLDLPGRRPAPGQHPYLRHASQPAPVWHLRKVPGGEIASSYLESFERVWEVATPCERPDRGPQDRLSRRPDAPKPQQHGPVGQRRGGQRRRRDPAHPPFG